MMTYATDANGVFVIEDKHLTSDMAYALATMIEKELGGYYQVYPTNIETDYTYTDISETVDQSHSHMSAYFDATGENKYLTNLKRFFEEASFQDQSDNYNQNIQFVNPEYYPLLASIAKHQIKMLFTYFDYESEENHLTYNYVSITLNKDAFFKENRIQTEVSVLEESERKASVSELKEQGFINPDNFSTKREFDRGGWSWVFRSKEEYEEWLKTPDVQKWLSADKLDFVNEDGEECAVNTRSGQFMPMD